jgi:hypothetical protein
MADLACDTLGRQSAWRAPTCTRMARQHTCSWCTRTRTTHARPHLHTHTALFTHALALRGIDNGAGPLEKVVGLYRHKYSALLPNPGHGRDAATFHPSVTKPSTSPEPGAPALEWTGTGGWTAGFFPGLLWNLANTTGAGSASPDAKLSELFAAGAAVATKGLEPESACCCSFFGYNMSSPASLRSSLCHFLACFLRTPVSTRCLGLAPFVSPGRVMLLSLAPAHK